MRIPPSVTLQVAAIPSRGDHRTGIARGDCAGSLVHGTGCSHGARARVASAAAPTYHRHVLAVSQSVGSAAVSATGTSHENVSPPAAAPIACATRKAPTSAGRMPAKVSLNARAMVTAGFANDVDAVNGEPGERADTQGTIEQQDPRRRILGAEAGRGSLVDEPLIERGKVIRIGSERNGMRSPKLRRVPRASRGGSTTPLRPQQRCRRRGDPGSSRASGSR